MFQSTTLVRLLVISCLVPLAVLEASGQSADPFGGPAARQSPFSQPASGDPFAPQAQRPSRQDQRPSRQAKPAVTPRNAAAAEKGQQSGEQPQQASDEFAPVLESKADARIRKTLDDETSQTFIQTPLSEALRVISDLHEIPIVLDVRALEEVGIDHDIPVNIDLRRVSLRSFLRLMLRDIALTYQIKDEVLQITTVEAAESELITNMYVLPKALGAKSEQVVKALTSTVHPHVWEVTGGPSSAVAIDHVLIISATSDVQLRTQSFLRTLRTAYEKSASEL